MNHLKTALIIVSMILGVSVGLSASYMIFEEQRQDRNYCIDVEQGIDEQMEDGFVNCVTPDKLEANISDEVKDSSNVNCICRRFNNGVIQQIQIATAG